MKKRLLKILAPLIFLLSVPFLVLAEEGYTPMLSSSMFDGIKADLYVMVGGIVTLFFITLGLVMLMRAGGR